MWVFHSLMFILLLFSVLGFTVLNSQETVNINLYWQQFYNISIVIALFVAFMLGLVFWFIISTANNLVLRADNRSLTRKMNELKDEVRELRNAALLDEETEEPDTRSQLPTRYESE